MKSGNAFTLIELLIVVSIIAILAAIGVPNFLEAQTRSKVSRTKADFQAVASALESYHVDHSHYPQQATSGNTWERLYVLSTPVAYITTGALPDPFCREKAGDIYYRYSNYMKGESGAATPEGAEVLRWGLRGRGPDGVMERSQDTLLAGGRIAPNSVYDPTNGTVSRGDVQRTGGRGTENQ